MKDFEASKNILEYILNKDIPFAVALRNGFKKFASDLDVNTGNVTAIVGCTLRHHFLFKKIVEEKFKLQENSEYIPIAIAMANILYLKRFANKEIIADCKKCSSVPSKELDEFFNNLDNIEQEINENMDKDSPEYLSYRFNTPIWIIRMWQRQYGSSLTFKILKANYRPALTTVRLNNLVVDKKQILANPDFEETEVNDIFTYKGKIPLKKQEFFENNGLFYQKMATKVIIDELELEPFYKMAIFTSYPNNIYLDLASRFGRDVSFDIMTKHSATYLETKTMIKKFGLMNTNLFEVDYTSMIACVSGQLDVMFVLPRNSSFDLLRSTPDYFLRLKQEELDEIISYQKECLNESSKYIVKDGRIVYMVPTICMKESRNQIASFISSHPNFKLEKERQFFPFESFDSCLYYAVLRKIKDD